MSETKHQTAEEQGRSAMRDFWEKTAPARDEVAKQTRAAVDDIRIKVVEEGWTGKEQTTPAQEVRSADLYGQTQTTDQQQGTAEQANTAADLLGRNTQQAENAQDLYGPKDLSHDDPGQVDPEQDGPDMER